MAGKRDKDGGDIGLLLIVLAVAGLVLLTIAVYAAPIILIVGIIYYEIRAGRPPGDFALSAEEAEELSAVGSRFSVVRQRLDEIGEEGAHLKQNADGMYHRGAPIHLVQATLGHASITTTGRYLHARPKESSSRFLSL